jgi:hypothetical protein
MQDATVGFSLQTRLCAYSGGGVARNLRGTVVIPLAGFSVSSVPLTRVVTIAHAIREGAPTGRTNKAQANGLGLEMTLNPKRRAL